MAFAIPGYQLRQGSQLDRALILQFLAKTHAELSGIQSADHLAETVERHLSAATPVWWVSLQDTAQTPVACLWLGNAIDQQQGDRHAYIMMLYVIPEHRRRGIATALLETAQHWATQRGDRQIGLQVFADNAAALALYRKLGYHTQALWLTCPLEDSQ
ncbi:MAG: GNAT family N-acetyltransferase [Cyanobacteria bacterium J06638_20]